MGKMRKMVMSTRILDLSKLSNYIKWQAAFT